MLPGSGLSTREAPRLLESYSNDTWLVGDVVLRICWRGHRGRLVREGSIGRSLPKGVPYPEVIAWGERDELTWLATRRVHGETLEVAWQRMSIAARRACTSQIAGILHDLHAWSPSRELSALISARPPEAFTTFDVIAGSDLNPLPAERALTLALGVAGLANVDRGLIEEAAAQIAELREFDPFALDNGTLAHSDLHLANIVCRETGIAALIDFEWARFAPADFDLDVLVRTVEYKRTLGVEAPEMAVLSALRSEYPALFGHPDLRERLRLYALTSCLREITGWPLQGPQSESPEHPIRQLRRVVTEPAAFERLLAGILG